MTSNLPDIIKDKYNDQGYNQLTPYNQTISLHDFFEEYDLYNLIQEIKSSSRALRNSDYANADVKKVFYQKYSEDGCRFQKYFLH